VSFIWLLWQREIQKIRDKLAKVNAELGDNKVIAEIAARNPEMREALRSMGVRQMVLKEYGVYCAKCKVFIRINTYEFEPPKKPAPDFFPADGGEKLRCAACGDVCVYGKMDIVHRPAN
jgi:ferredoxin